MAVRIRLRRMGRKKQPHYRIVVAEGEFPRDGRIVENLGYYKPLSDPARIVVDMERADFWIARGAAPSGTVKSLLGKARRGGDATLAVGAEDVEARRQAETDELTARRAAEKKAQAEEAAAAKEAKDAEAKAAAEAAEAEAKAKAEAAEAEAGAAEVEAGADASVEGASGEEDAEVDATEADVAPAPKKRAKKAEAKVDADEG